MTIQFKAFCGLIASLCIFTNAFPQVSEIKNLERPGVTSHVVKIYQNVLDEFQEQFPGAENIKWSQVGKNFLSNFDYTGKRYAVLFDPRANEKYRIIYGHEKDMPVEIRKWVKRVYIEFNISSAILVMEAGRRIWLINVADGSEFAWVKVENDEMQELKRYKKYVPDNNSRESLAKQQGNL